MSRLPRIPFPGPVPSTPITFLGKTYTYNDAVLKSTTIDGTTGRVSCLWRLYDYDNQVEITDQEAWLLEVLPDIAISEPNIYVRAAVDPVVANAMGLVLCAAYVASKWPALDAAASEAGLAQSAVDADKAAKGLADAAKAAADQAVMDATAAKSAADGALEVAQGQLLIDQGNGADQTTLDADQAAIDARQTEATAAAATLGEKTTSASQAADAVAAADTTLAVGTGKLTAAQGTLAQVQGTIAAIEHAFTGQ